jgi:adenylylsulfate kinase-like enzyme
MITLPVLWLYGPSGIGKTTVSWELFLQLVREGAAGAAHRRGAWPATS